MKKYQSLKSYFNDKTSYDNVIDIMNTVKGNRELRRFFKAVILCCLAKQDGKMHKNKWMTPDQYFTPDDYKPPHWADKYDINRLKEQYRQYLQCARYTVFGRNVREFIETMI